MAMNDIVTISEALTLSAYIAELQALKAAHGDLPVQKWMPSKGRHAAPVPKIAYARVVRDQGRTGVRAIALRAFWQEDFDPISERGDMLVRV